MPVGSACNAAAGLADRQVLVTGWSPPLMLLRATSLVIALAVLTTVVSCLGVHANSKLISAWCGGGGHGSSRTRVCCLLRTHLTTQLRTVLSPMTRAVAVPADVVILIAAPPLTLRLTCATWCLGVMTLGLVVGVLELGPGLPRTTLGELTP